MLHKLMSEAIDQGVSTFARLGDFGYRILEWSSKIGERINGAMIAGLKAAGVSDEYAKLIARISVPGKDTFAKAKELGHASDAKIVKYGPPFSLGRVLRMLTKSGDTRIELTLPGQLTPQLQSGRAYFLPSFYAP